MTEDTKASTTDDPEPSSQPSSAPAGANPAVEGGAVEGSAAEGSAEETAADELASAQADAARYKDQLLRTAADFDNFRKRTRRELEDAERRGRDDLLKELLPVFDNFERATAHAAAAEATGGVKALVEGIELVMRQFTDTLRKLGVERVPAVGHPFDPAVHEAIQHMEGTEYPAGFIAAEVQAGYKTAERLVRPALVVVAKGGAAPPSDVDDGGSSGPSDEAN